MLFLHFRMHRHYTRTNDVIVVIITNMIKSIVNIVEHNTLWWIIIGQLQLPNNDRQGKCILIAL